MGADAGDPVEELAELLGRQLPFSVGADGAARLQGGGEGGVAPGDLLARGPVQIHGRSVRGGLHGGLGVDLAAVRVDGAEHVVVAPGADAGVEQQVVEVPLPQRRLRVGGERAVLVGGFDEAGAHEVGERVEGVVLAQAGAERAGRARVRPGRPTSSRAARSTSTARNFTSGDSRTSTPSRVRQNANRERRTVVPGATTAIRCSASRAVGSTRRSSLRSAGPPRVRTLRATQMARAVEEPFHLDGLGGPQPVQQLAHGARPFGEPAERGADAAAHRSQRERGGGARRVADSPSKRTRTSARNAGVVRGGVSSCIRISGSSGLRLRRVRRGGCAYPEHLTATATTDAPPVSREIGDVIAWP